MLRAGTARCPRCSGHRKLLARRHEELLQQVPCALGSRAGSQPARAQPCLQTRPVGEWKLAPEKAAGLHHPSAIAAPCWCSSRVLHGQTWLLFVRFKQQERLEELPKIPKTLQRCEPLASLARGQGHAASRLHCPGRRTPRSAVHLRGATKGYGEEIWGLQTLN